jgi:hypothetical protein
VRVTDEARITDEVTGDFLHRFVSAVQPVLPLVSVPARPHLTWAHEEFMRQPVTPVTRRELHDFGLLLYGQEQWPCFRR